MEFFERARLYGNAVSVIDEFLGETMRERVMERFTQMAGPLQRGGMRDPWEMIAAAAQAAGVKPATIEALHLVYMMRTDRWEDASFKAQPSEEVLEHLKSWGVLGAYEAGKKGSGR